MGRVTVARRRVIAAAERSKGSRRLLQLGSSFGLRWAKAKRGPRHGLRSGTGKGVGSVIGTIMIITAFWWFHSRAMRARKREATKGAERIV